MTLIATVISNLGLIQASDSNLSTDSGAAGCGQKVFRLEFADAALALAGAYSVGGEPMNAWIYEFIGEYGREAQPTLPDFAERLGQRLTNDISDAERESGTLIHIVGYVADDEGAHPEMRFVRNIQGINGATGDYEGRTDKFLVSEDFWNRDFGSPKSKQALASGGSQRYFNGFPPARITYHAVGNLLNQSFQEIWDQPAWDFRRPKSLDELADFVDVEIRAIGALFKSSDYDAPYVGGEPQIEAILPPPGAVDLAK